MQKETLKQMLAMCDEVRALSFQVDAHAQVLQAQKDRVAQLSERVSDVATLVTATQNKRQEIDARLAELQRDLPE